VDPETDDVAAAREHVLKQVVAFGRTLRREGVSVPANASLPAVEALSEVGLDERDRVRAALFATLVSDPRDAAAFDEHFPAFWNRLRRGLAVIAANDGDGNPLAEADGGPSSDVEGVLPDSVVESALEGEGDFDDEEGTVRSRRFEERDDVEPEGEATEERPGTYSSSGGRSLVADESSDAVIDERVIRRFERAVATLPGRRWSRSHAGEGVDARRALRESLGTGGVALTLPRREPDLDAFRACVLVDVSRSVLDSIDRRFLLSVVDSLVADGRSVRVFFFDTDVREVTDVFAGPHGDPARALEHAEVEWGGGTRIGESIRALRERWPEAVGRRTVTIVVSDGLEVGDVPDLEDGMAWLSGHSGGVLWLNPLATSTAYEPTCRGMEAALPYVDGLFAFGGEGDLEEVARQLERRGLTGPVGYLHDFRERGGVSP